ncbi:MAG: hypothetical protein KDA72_12875 [Planctomycetales bacterium]|nr:hypothetical protein [Planctomycetales bacterium]
MARYDDLSTGPIAYAAFVSTVILLVVILLVRALCYSWVESEDAKRLVDAHYVASDAEIARQKSEISNYAKVQVPAAAADEATAGAKPEMEDRLHIPVSVAEELLLKDWNATDAGQKE